MKDKAFNSNRLTKKQRQEKANVEQNLKISSKLGIITIFVCAAIALSAFFITSSFDSTERPQPKFVPADAVKVSSLSTSWACPITRGGSGSDSIIISNPDESRSANVEISIFDQQGTKAKSHTLTIEPKSFIVKDASALGIAEKSSVFVESFSAPIAVSRSLNLSDGEELIGCINDLRSIASFPNLITVRNTNSVLALSNPYEEAVVVDVQASLLNSTQEGSVPVLDDVKGQIIPAKGRLDLDLQTLFGRFDVVSVDVVSRSGFFAAEALITYTQAHEFTGQTLIPAARNLSVSSQLHWVGIDPTRIVATNGSDNTHSINFTVLAEDKRSLSPSPKLIAPGTAAVLENLGLDFGPRTATLSIEAGPNKPKNIYAAWIHASVNAVSSGSQEGQNSKTHLLGVTIDSRLNIFNSSKKDATVRYSILGSKEIKSKTVKAGTFVIIDLVDLTINSTSMLYVESTQDVVVASSNSNSSYYVPSIEILP